MKSLDDTDDQSAQSPTVRGKKWRIQRKDNTTHDYASDPSSTDIHTPQVA